MSDPRTDAILDAARSSVLEFGIGRTTLSDVARRAAVSRTTVYRRFPDVDAMLGELMRREFGGLVDEAARLMEAAKRDVDGADGRARVVARLLAAATAIRDHPLLRKVLRAEPELLLPYMLGRIGTTQRHALALIESDVERGQHDDSIRPGDAAAIARGLLVVTQSFVFAAALAPRREAEAMFEELRRLADSSLSHPPPATRP